MTRTKTHRRGVAFALTVLITSLWGVAPAAAEGGH